MLLNVSAPAFLQAPLDALTGLDLPVGRVSIAVTRGSACGYTGVVDNITGDLAIVPAVRLPAAPRPPGQIELVSSAIAQVMGVNGSQWHTDARLANPGTAAVNVKAYLLAALNDVPEAASLSLSPGRAIEIRDVVQSLFNVSDPVVGAVLWRLDGPLLVQTRTRQRERSPRTASPGVLSAVRLVDYRTNAENVGQFYVKNRNGTMVPLSAITRFEPRPGPEFTMRYNLFRCAQINGSAAPGYSSDQAMAALEQVFTQTMPAEMGYDYLGMSFQEKKAQQGVPPSVIFALSLLFVFLILAALYESWTLPFSVLLSTPIAVFGAFVILWLRRSLISVFYPPYMVQIESDVYSQIGLVMLIGLAAKNAILIVEFAKDEHDKGRPLVESALEGARLRLRPILMTSLAFTMGVIPLMLSSGAGSEMRQAIGIAVFFGMLGVTAFGLVLNASGKRNIAS